jgi:hypothetical protein
MEIPIEGDDAPIVEQMPQVVVGPALPEADLEHETFEAREFVSRMVEPRLLRGEPIQQALEPGSVSDVPHEDDRACGRRLPNARDLP